MPREIAVVRQHGYRVIVLSESVKGKAVYGNLGDRRWECEWYALTPSAKRRRESDPDYEHDRDRDEVTLVTTHASKEAAVEAAKRVVPESVYGCALVQEHVLEMFVEKDGVADWEPVGPKFEVDGDGDVAEI